MITVIDRDNNQERYQPMGSVSEKDQLRICPCQVRDGGNSFPTETQWFISSNYSPVTIPIISWSGYETQWLQVYETSYRVPLQSPSFFCLLSTASYVYLHIHELCKNQYYIMHYFGLDSFFIIIIFISIHSISTVFCENIALL